MVRGHFSLQQAVLRPKGYDHDCDYWAQTGYSCETLQDVWNMARSLHSCDKSRQRTDHSAWFIAKMLSPC